MLRHGLWRHGHSAGTMHKGMASSTQRDQVLLAIITALAAKLLVVNPPDSIWSHNIGTSSRHGAVPVLVAVHTTGNQAAGAGVWVEFGSRSFRGHFVQETLPLFARKELEKSGH